MKKHFLITILLIAFSIAATAQNKKIAILETVDKKGDVPYGILLQLRSNLTYAISNTPGYEGYDRVDMASIIGEHDFQRTGMVSNEQIRQLGEMTGCSSILVAEAAVYDKDNIIITAKILNVESTSVEKAVPPQIANTNPKEMQNACIELAAKLIEKESMPQKPTANNKPMKKENPVKTNKKSKQVFGVNVGLGYTPYKGVDMVVDSILYGGGGKGGIPVTLGIDVAFPINNVLSVGIFVSGGYRFEVIGNPYSIQMGPLLLYNNNNGESMYFGVGLSYFNSFGPVFRLGYKFSNGIYFFAEYDHINYMYVNDSNTYSGDFTTNSFLLHLGYWF